MTGRHVMFVLPRADWIAANESLIAMLGGDADVRVTVVAPQGFAAPRSFGRATLISYPFYAAAPTGSLLSRGREHIRAARERRRLVDEALDAGRPDCIVVISDTSRELVPFVDVARRRGIRVVFMQSVFLARSIKQHVRRENWQLIKSRGVAGLAMLVGLRGLQVMAGLPGSIFKRSAVGASSDAVFTINEHQRDVLSETVPSNRMYATGTPLLDFLRSTVVDAPKRSGREAFCASLGLDVDRPIVAYFSKSLAQFCHATPDVERDAQEFFVTTILQQLPAANVVVKLHPIEDDGAFQAFAGNPRVRVVKELDGHALIHHANLVISLGPSTPAFHALFHDRPRLIISRIGDIVLDYQRDLLDVSVAVASREEYSAALEELKNAEWPRRLSPRFQSTAGQLDRFTEGFDGAATLRVHSRLREWLGLPAAV